MIASNMDADHSENSKISLLDPKTGESKMLTYGESRIVAISEGTKTANSFIKALNLTVALMTYG
jgi:hypothetical protein